MIRKPKSPYQKYNKRPFRYSDQLKNWQKNLTEKTEELHRVYLRDVLGWRPDPVALEAMRYSKNPYPYKFWINQVI